MIHITRHAIDRCIERVPGTTTEDQARTLLSSRAILAAAQFGAKYVRLGTGHRVVIEEGRVTTVLPTNTHTWKMGSRWDRIRQHARGWAKLYREDNAA